jgi:hypothetical protein
MYSDGQIFVFLVSPLVLVIKSLDLHANLLNLVEPAIIHPLLEGVLSDQLFNVNARLLEVDFEQINLFSQIEYRVLVYLAFYPE